MASERKTYPYITTKAWWALRKKFNQSIPSQVTPSYLVTLLGGKPISVKKNVLVALQTLGLVDQDGSTTSRAKLWRDDTRYSDVCKEIRDEIYPPDLLSAIPGPTIDADAAKRWFKTETGCGEDAARKMVGMYALLTAADPYGGDQVTAPKSKDAMLADSKKRPKTIAASKKTVPVARQDRGSGGASIPRLDMPQMRLSVEIRIDASVTPDQIDLIFASMAKHLYGRDDAKQ